jgi:two-component sensor histidine kinase
MRRLLIITVTLHFLLPAAFAQGPARDSAKLLILQLSKVGSDTQKIRSLIHLGDYIMKKPGESRQQIDSAMIFFNRGITMARRIQATKMEMEGRSKAGVNLYENRDSVAGAAQFRIAAAYYQHSGSSLDKADFWFAYGTTLLTCTSDHSATSAALQKADILYSRLKMKPQVMNTLINIAALHRNMGKNNDALKEYLEVEQAYERVGKLNELSACQINIAELYWKKGNIQQTLFYNARALNTAEKLKDESMVFSANLSLASLYYNLKMFDKALIYIQSAYNYAYKTKDSINFYTCLLSIVHVRVKLNQTDGILEFIENARKYDPAVSEITQASLYETYGLAYDALGDQQRAENNFLSAMKIFNEAQKKHLYGTAVTIYIRAFNRAIGDFYIKHKKYSLARPYFLRVLELPKSVITPNTEIEIRSALYKIDSAAGNYNSALKNYQLKTQLHDSLFNANAVKQVSELNAKYETDQRLKDIKLLKSQRDAQRLLNQKITGQRNLTFACIAGLLIIAGLSLAGYSNKKYLNRRLEIQQSKIKQQNDSLQGLLSEKEILLDEKEWLLKEIHHRVKNNLQIIMSLLNSQSVYTEDPVALEALKISRDRVQAISLIHKKLSGDNNLATVNMKSYVAELVDYLKNGFGESQEEISFKQLIEPVEIDIAQAVSIALILNEAITNSMKYAFKEKVGEIILSLNLIEEETILLTIKDNGKGFDTGRQDLTSLGFKIMKGLAAQLKGEFTMKDDAGIYISVKFPLKKPQFRQTAKFHLNI